MVASSCSFISRQEIYFYFKIFFINGEFFSLIVYNCIIGVSSMLIFLRKLVTSTKFWSVIILVLGTIIFYQAIDYSLKKYINSKKKRATLAQKKRFTILTLCCSCLKYILALMDIVMILGLFGIKVTAFLAGLGIIAIVVGLALQDLLKDFIAGLFIILDDQYNVGDTVEIDGFKGDVIAVGLKSTKIKNGPGNFFYSLSCNSKETSPFTFPSAPSGAWRYSR